MVVRWLRLMRRVFIAAFLSFVRVYTGRERLLGGQQADLLAMQMPRSPRACTIACGFMLGTLMLRINGEAFAGLLILTPSRPESRSLKDVLRVFT